MSRTADCRSPSKTAVRWRRGSRDDRLLRSAGIYIQAAWKALARDLAASPRSRERQGARPAPPPIRGAARRPLVFLSRTPPRTPTRRRAGRTFEERGIAVWQDAQNLRGENSTKIDRIHPARGLLRLRPDREHGPARRSAPRRRLQPRARAGARARDGPARAYAFVFSVGQHQPRFDRNSLPFSASSTTPSTASTPSRPRFSSRSQWRSEHCLRRLARRDHPSRHRGARY